MSSYAHNTASLTSLYTSLFLFSVLVNLLMSGGRLASSDELAVYLTTESLVERGELAISPELVKNGIYGRGGKFYYGVGIAQPALSTPLYIGGKLMADLVELSEPMRTFAIKASVSFLNQVFGGLIAVVMFAFGVKLGYSRRLSLFLTLGLLFTTNLFPYLKSYMREPQLLFTYAVKTAMHYHYASICGSLASAGDGPIPQAVRSFSRAPSREAA